MNDPKDDWVMTHWYTGDMCPQCENAVLYTNGWIEWCECCEYSRKPIDAELDSADKGYEGHLPGLA